MFADYTNGITNLACSILKNYGAEYTHDTLRELDTLLEYPYKNVVVMLFDGMGMDALKHHLPETSFLRTHLLSEYSSVFPPTTTAATTTIESGLTPVEHGWLGWSLYFSEVNKIVNAFHNTMNDTRDQAAKFHVAGRYLPYKSIYEKINETGNAKSYSVSRFGSNKINTLAELFQETTRLTQQEDRKYIYTYWDQPDGEMHDHGCYASTVAVTIQEIDQRVQHMCETLQDTLVIVTADHGHNNLTYYILSDYPDIAEMLQRPISLEARAAAFYIKKEYLSEFPIKFHERFGEDFILLTKEQVKEQKLFGDGIPHPKFEAFIGDYLAVAIADKGIVFSRKSNIFKSNHSGATEKEMMIPLIVVDKK